VAVREFAFDHDSGEVRSVPWSSAYTAVVGRKTRALTARTSAVERGVFMAHASVLLFSDESREDHPHSAGVIHKARCPRSVRLEVVSDQSAYQRSGVDTRAGDLAVEMMRSHVQATHSDNVLGGFGGFAGLFDASALKEFERPVLATSTDGVGTKIEIARAMNRHDTIGQDLVAMVIDDIVVAGARPLFLTDYIACGAVEPERIATIVSGIARACEASGVALIGGETAEHPGVLDPDEYDVAAAVTGVVEHAHILGPHRVTAGDVVVAVASSGLHSNGYSLVRQIVADKKLSLTDAVPGITQSLGEVLLEPTLVYTPGMLQVLDAHQGAVHAASHITGGGIAQNLQRVLPEGLALSLSRGSWEIPPVFSYLCHQAGLGLGDVEDTWNVGIGFAVVVETGSEQGVIDAWESAGYTAWAAGVIEDAAGRTGESAKGVSGGLVELTGSWED
jgi:phosphoribosylformylglycinamidine cyclo-ligase